MKRTSIAILIISIVAVAALGIYVAAEDAPGYQQGKPAQAVAPAANQAFTYKHPLEILSTVSGKTVDELRELAAGKGVWAVVEELKLTEKFTQAFSEYKLSYVDYLVSIGKVTKEEAEAWKAEFKANVAAGTLGKELAGDCDMNLGMRFGNSNGMGGRGRGGCRMGGNMNGAGMKGRVMVQGKGMMGGNWN